MGLRPARTCRAPVGQVWARLSQKKPRKSYVKGAPNVRVRQFNMGTSQYYELEVDLVSEEDIQLRDNALESARQATNKFLEKNLIDKYFFQIVKYPHLVLREHSALGVAGADRISKGMKRAFGKPKGRLARVKEGDIIFRVQTFKNNLQIVKEALKRAQRKMSGHFALVIRDITADAINLARKGRIVTFKKKEEEPKPAAAPAEAKPEAAAATGEKAKPEEAATAKKEEKAEEGKEKKK